MPTNNTPDNWACFRRILEQLLDTTETQAELLRSLLEEGDHADHLDFIEQLKFDDAPEAITLLEEWKPKRRKSDAPKANTHWSDEADNDLRTLFKYGMTDEQIGDLLGRTPHAIARRREVLRLIRRVV